MAVNPMQRKANNSFLLGMLITLLITGIIIAFLILQLSKVNKEKQVEEAEKVYGYVITTEVKSGTEIASTQVKGVEINSGVNSSIVYSSKSDFPSGLKAKVDLHPGTIVTSDVTYEEEQLANDVRTQEYNIITLNSHIENGDYVDIRLRLPSGQDYIVVSHKEVTIPQIGGVDSSKCIWLNLNETEILMMSSAIIEAYKAEGSSLYASKYVEPGLQTAATATYLPTDGTLTLMSKDPNAVQEAKTALFIRTNPTIKDENGQTVNNPKYDKDVIRKPINDATNGENAQENVNTKTIQEIQGLQEEREKYLEALGG